MSEISFEVLKGFLDFMISMNQMKYSIKFSNCNDVPQANFLVITQVSVTKQLFFHMNFFV